MLSQNPIYSHHKHKPKKQKKRTHMSSLFRGATGKHYQACNLLCASVIDV